MGHGSATDGVGVDLGDHPFQDGRIDLRQHAVAQVEHVARMPTVAGQHVGHFGFEKNRPATFKYPLRSLLCDWIMWKDILATRIPLFGELSDEHYAPRP